MRAAFRQAGFWTLIAVYAVLWTGGTSWHQLPGLCHHHTHHTDGECGHAHVDEAACLAVRVVLPHETTLEIAEEIDWPDGDVRRQSRHDREKSSDRFLPREPIGGHRAPLPVHEDDCQLCRWYVQSHVSVAAVDIPLDAEYCDEVSAPRAASPLIPAILCYETRGPPVLA